MSNLFIGGKWVAPLEGETVAVVAPATGEPIAEIARGKAKDVDRAVTAAQAALAAHSGIDFVTFTGSNEVGGVELPFGGVKKIGHGREKGFLAMEEMSTTKTLVHFHG